MEFKVFVAFMAVLIIVALIVRRGKKEDLEEEESTLLDEHFRSSPDDGPVQTSTGESGSGISFR